MAKPHTQPSSTTSTSTTTSTNNNSNSSSSSYYNRLLHQCTKQLHKQVKKTKTFVLQKAIRKNKKNSNAKIEQRIQEIKDLDINLVVQEALHRLGIYKLNPNETDAATTTTTPRSSSNLLLLEQIFSHTHMQTAMEEWNQQVSNFHRWSLRQHPNDNSQEPSNIVLPNASVFYHPASSSFTTTTTTTLHNKKKNRMGQRARRAKALAQEQTHSSSSTTNHHPVSTNWRTKTKPPHSNITTTTTGTQQHQDDNNSLHPSWQARKQDKNNIVPFQGTKITF